MIVYCKLELYLPTVRSLKEKRSIIKSLQKKLQNKFNIAIAEIDKNDIWKNTVLGVVSISNNSSNLESMISNIIDFIDDFYEAQISNYTIEYL